MNFENDWFLSVLTFTPLVGAVIMMALPKADETLHKVIALAVSGGLLIFGTIYMLTQFDFDNSGEMQFTFDTNWISVINSRYIVGVDGMVLPLILLTLLVVPLCVIYSWNHFPEPANPKAFLILILILETGMLGTFVAEDLILFFVFFEVVLLPMFFMIAVWGGPDRKYASLKFFLYTLFGSALMILAFLSVFFLAEDASGQAMVILDIQSLTEGMRGDLAQPFGSCMVCVVRMRIDIKE